MGCPCLPFFQWYFLLHTSTGNTVSKNGCKKYSRKPVIVLKYVLQFHNKKKETIQPPFPLVIPIPALPDVAQLLQVSSSNVDVIDALFAFSR